MPEMKPELLRETERVFGRKILNASDCQALSIDIFKRIQKKISLNTLRRAFNLMKTAYQPSLFTLDVLSEYCGYNSFSEFGKREKKQHEPISGEMGSLIDFIFFLFRDNEIKQLHDSSYLALVNAVVINLEQWPHLIDQLQFRIAKTANGQTFYFEQFVNVDKINSYYGDGLRYYLHEKKKPLAQVFGHSMLCFGSWLAEDHAGLESHYRQVIRHNVDEHTEPFLAGRYFASQIYYAHSAQAELHEPMEAARLFYEASTGLKINHKTFPGFEYVMAETLVLTGQYEEALFYIQEAIRKRNNPVPAHIDARLFESVYLFQATALAHLGKIEKARDVFESISTSNFSFLSRQFNSILYLLLKKVFDKRNFQDKQLQYLVKQTAFTRLVAHLPAITQVA